MTERDYEERFIPVEDAERAIIATGEWEGTTIEFSDDGKEWADWWLPTEGHDFPALARATVHRAGVKIPTVVTVLWIEYYPDDDPDRAASWDKLKTVLLSKVARMAAYRQAFRDVIGNRYDPAELDQAQRGPTIPSRDWLAELAEVTTGGQLAKLYGDARASRAFTGGEAGDKLQAAFSLHAAVIEHAAAEPEQAPPQDLDALAEAIVPKPGPGVQRCATGEGVRREQQRKRQRTR